jgi:hypothetical protein
VTVETEDGRTVRVPHDKVLFIVREKPPKRTPSPSKPPKAALVGPAADILADYRKAMGGKRHEVSLQLVRDTLKRLASFGSGATPALAHALATSTDWRVRWLAVRALKPLKDEAALPALIKALGDPFRGGYATGASLSIAKYVIRDEAVKALRALGRAAHDVLRASAADAEDPNQVHAANGLRMLDVPERAKVLIPVARDATLPAAVRNAALAGLVKQGRAAHQAMADLLADPAVRKAAAKGLKFSKDAGVFPTLLGYVRDAREDPVLASEAATAIVWTDPHWRPVALKDQVDLLLFRMPATRIRDELGDAALPRLRHWAGSDSMRMRRAAKRALAQY